MNKVTFPCKTQSTVLVIYCYFTAKSVINKNKQYSRQLFPMKGKRGPSRMKLCASTIHWSQQWQQKKYWKPTMLCQRKFSPTWNKGRKNQIFHHSVDRQQEQAFASWYSQQKQDREHDHLKIEKRQWVLLQYILPVSCNVTGKMAWMLRKLTKNNQLQQLKLSSTLLRWYNLSCWCLISSYLWLRNCPM